MSDSRLKIANNKSFLEGELRDMADALKANPSLSTKISSDVDSDFDNRKFCINSILTHIKGLDEMKKGSADESTRLNVIEDCMKIYKRTKEGKYSQASNQIRSLIFAELTGEYKPDASFKAAESVPFQTSKSQPLPEKNKVEVRSRSASDAPSPKAGSLRSFSVFKKAPAPAAASPKKTINCEVIAMQVAPTIENLKALPITSKRAYIRCGNDLYYVNKTKESVVKLKDINADMLRRFDDAAQPKENAKLLSKLELNAIAGIIGNKGHNYVSPKEAGEKKTFSPK